MDIFVLHLHYITLLLPEPTPLCWYVRLQLGSGSLAGCTEIITCTLKYVNNWLLVKFLHGEIAKVEIILSKMYGINIQKSLYIILFLIRIVHHLQEVLLKKSDIFPSASDVCHPWNATDLHWFCLWCRKNKQQPKLILKKSQYRCLNNLKDLSVNNETWILVRGSTSALCRITSILKY